MIDYYDILGVARHAEPGVIEAAYKAMLKRRHPDVSQGGPAAEAKAQAINAAYAVLKDPDARARYDRAHAAKGAPKHTAFKPRTIGKFVVFLVACLALSIIGLSSVVILRLVRPKSASPSALLEASGPSEISAGRPQTPPSKTPGHARRRREPTGISLGRASFDCGRARGANQRLICEEPSLGGADIDLAEAYRRALAQAADPAALRAEQQAWLASRDSAQTDPAVLLRLYAERLATLKSRPAAAVPPD